MRILVTGGAGYIGTHTCVELIKAGHEVIVADNLINSRKEALDKVTEITGKEVTFYEVDVTEREEVEKIFEAHRIDGVIDLYSVLPPRFMETTWFPSRKP